MKLKSNEYQIECTPDGEYYAFLTDYHQRCTYGETAEEALETLSDIADEFFSEVNEVYLAEETRIKVTQPINHRILLQKPYLCDTDMVSFLS